MPQFLIQSGSVRMEVAAGDCHKAALWAVHQALESALPAEASGADAQVIGDGRLGRHVRVVRTDGLAAECFDTYAVLLEWSQLLVAIDQVESAINGRGNISGQTNVDPLLSDQGRLARA